MFETYTRNSRSRLLFIMNGDPSLKQGSNDCNGIKPRVLRHRDAQALTIKDFPMKNAKKSSPGAHEAARDGELGRVDLKPPRRSTHTRYDYSGR